MREGSSIFKSLHAASIVNREILHLQKKKGYDADQKTFRLHTQFSSQVIYLFTVLNFSR